MRKKRLIKLAVFLLAIVVLVIIAKSFLNQLNQPVSGKVTLSDSKSDQPKYQVDLTPKPITGKYASFNYPAGMAAKTPAPFAAPEVEEFNFTARDTTAWLLAIDISMPRGGVLTNDSGYTYRVNNPDHYQASQTTVNGQSVTIMTDKSANFNKVAYLTHGPLLATVALSGNDAAGTQPLETTLSMVLSSWVWL